MNEKIIVELTVDELRVLVSLLENHPNHFTQVAHRKAVNSSASADVQLQAQLADRLSLELAKHAS